MPPGWWHAVLNLEETVSVTQNFVNDQNVKLATEFLFNQEMEQMLSYWKEKLKCVNYDVYKTVQTKERLLKGKVLFNAMDSDEE